MRKWVWFFFFFFGFGFFFFESGAPLLEPELREHARKRGHSCVCVCEGERENKNCLVVGFFEWVREREREVIGKRKRFDFWGKRRCEERGVHGWSTWQMVGVHVLRGSPVFCFFDFLCVGRLGCSFECLFFFFVAFLKREEWESLFVRIQLCVHFLST